MKECFKRTIKKRLIWIPGMATLIFGISILGRSSKSILFVAAESIVFASHLVVMFSGLIGFISLGKIALLWRKYRKQGAMDVIFEHPFDPTIGFKDKVLNEDGIHVRNEMFVNLGLFLIGVLVVAFLSLIANLLIIN